MKLSRHGDVLLVPVDKAPKGKLTRAKSYVVAYGEATGHSHTLVSDSDIEVVEGINTYVTLKTNGTLTHQEHKTLTVKPGTYKVVREREFDYFLTESRRVID